MSKRTSILKKLMIITSVMTMTFGGSMTAFAAEGCGCGGQEIPVEVHFEEEASEDESKMLGNPDEAQTESETARYEEYKNSDIDDYGKETAEEIDKWENFTDPDNQKTPMEYAKDREEGEAPLETLNEGEAHITITDTELDGEDVLEGRTEVVAFTNNSNAPLNADEQSAEGTEYIVTLNTTNTSTGNGSIEAAVTVPVASTCDDPESAVAYVDSNYGFFKPIEKVDLYYNKENGTWTVKLTLTRTQQNVVNDNVEYPASYMNYGSIYYIKYDAVKKQVVVEPSVPGEEPSVNENETVIAVVDANGVSNSQETSTVAPVNDYYQFNLNAAKAIREAAYGSTVEIDAGEYVSFADFVIEEIDKRPDLTINVSYIDAANLHTREQIVIPARAVESDGTVLGESRIEEPETQYYGFKYVDSKINA